MAQAVTSGYKNLAYQTANEPWELLVEPFRVAPRVYYIGNKWVGAYLVDCGTELVLIDTCVYENVYLTLEGIRKLGFDPHQLSHILLSHCHIDHAGGARALKEYTGAKIWLSKEDADFRESPANSAMGDEFKMIPYEVDAFYQEEKPLRVGDVEIRTVLTPGHTPGTTSFFITMPDEKGKMLTMAMHGGVGVLTMNQEYLEKYGLPLDLCQRFIDDCERMKAFHVDITVPSHPAHFDLFGRRGDDPMDYTVFVDETQWSKFLDTRADFAREVL